MTVKANPTDAKDIAVRFFERTNQRATSAMFAKTIKQAKDLMLAGFTKDEILKVIDYATSTPNNIYSLGYFATAINKLLKEVERLEAIETVAEMARQTSIEVREVIDDGKSTERNQSKLRRLGVQSRFREKFDFDLFEEQQQDCGC